MNIHSKSIFGNVRGSRTLRTAAASSALVTAASVAGVGVAWGGPGDEAAPVEQSSTAAPEGNEVSDLADLKADDDQAGQDDQGTDDQGTDDQGTDDQGTDDQGTDDQDTDDQDTDDQDTDDQDTDDQDSQDDDEQAGQDD